MPSPSPCLHPLLATEHTEFDAGAERVGLALAKAFGVPLSVVLPVTSNPEAEAIDPAYAARADEAVATAVAAVRAAARAANVDCVVDVRRGDDPAAVIAADARARNADLVVIRRRGRRGFLARLLIGETVRAVVASAGCSVLLVPRACAFWSRRILAVVDADPLSRAVALDAVALAGACGLPLTLASTATVQAAEADALAAALQAAHAQSMQVDHRVVAAPLAEGIATLAAAVAADLVVIPRDDTHSGATQPFGALARTVVGLVQCPVLLVRGGAHR